MSVTNEELALPRSWSLTRLDRVASVNARIGWKALTASEYQDEGVIFLSTPNIKGRTIDFNRVNHIPAWRYDESPELKLQVGDVLLAKDGNTLGITNVVSHLPGPATVNGSIAVLRPRSVEPRFLRYALDSNLCQGMIGALRAGMGVPHLFQWDINRLQLPLPPFRTQRAIADFLDAETARIDALVTKKRALLHALNERARARAEWLILGGGTPHLLPHGWRWAPARRLCGQVTVGVVVNPSSYFVVDGVPFIHGTDIRRGWIDESAFKHLSAASNRLLRKSQVRAGDVLAMRVGEPGRAAVVPTHLDGANCASVLIFRRSEALASEILCAFLNSSVGRSQVEAVQYGAAQGVLNVSDALGLRVPVPPVQAQASIVRQLATNEAIRARAMNVINNQVLLLGEHRQTLITAAVTGELDIPGAA